MLSNSSMAKKQKKRALIVGLGDTGYSCARYMHQQGYRGSVVDSRDIPPMLKLLQDEYQDIDIHTGGFNDTLFRDQDVLVVSPGVPVQQPVIARAIAAGVEVVGDMELFARAAEAPIVAITGTNGKSTVTALVGAMLQYSGLQALLGGNIGLPVLSLLDQPVPDFYVLELSSFQLETTANLNAAVATVLNISPDHLDRYDNLQQYAEAKARILQGDGVIVVNANDALISSMLPEGRSSIRFSGHAPVDKDEFGLIDDNGEIWLAQGSRRLINSKALLLRGRHNYINVLAALALGVAIGQPLEPMLKAATKFQGLPHRSQIVADLDGVTWVDDSKATNAGATIAALQGQSAPVILIAGGEAKDSDFTQLQDAVRQHTKAVVLIGRDADLLETTLADCSQIHRAADMHDAVTQAREIAISGDIVLLAPACASFDMFRNYIHRGEVFQQTVREMAQQ